MNGIGLGGWSWGGWSIILKCEAECVVLSLVEPAGGMSIFKRNKQFGIKVIFVSDGHSM